MNDEVRRVDCYFALIFGRCTDSSLFLEDEDKLKLFFSLKKEDRDWI